MMLIQDIFQNRESKWWWKPNEYRFLGKTRNKIKRYIFKLVKYIRFCYHNEKIGKQQQQQMSCE